MKVAVFATYGMKRYPEAVIAYILYTCTEVLTQMKLPVFPGDVNGIQMQVIPQTHFIPLPEALCLIIMDLNNNRVVATLDTVCEKLQLCYQGHNLPSNQLVYDTLGTLIKERKVFHTGWYIEWIGMVSRFQRGHGWLIGIRV